MNLSGSAIVQSPRHEAPGPIARFPGSDVGWQLALRFMDMLGAKKP